MPRPIEEVRERLRPYASVALRWLAALAGFLLIALQAPWRVDPSTLVPSIDGAWMMSLTEAAAHGEISGRDIYATYGWAFQLIGLAARSLHAGHSSYDSTALLAVLLAVLGAAVLVAALLLVRSLEANGLLLACAAVAMLSLSQTAWLRPACLVFVAVLTARLLQTSPGRFRWRLIALAVFAASLQSLSFDLGVYAVLTIAGGTVLHALTDPSLPERSWRQRASEAGQRGIAVLGAGALTYIVFSLALSGGAPGPFTYLSILSRLSSGYPATLGHPWVAGPYWTWALALLVLFVVIAALADLRSANAAARAEAAPLLCAALLFARGGTIRSDIDHIALAAVPLVVAFLVLGLRTGQSLPRRLAATAVAVALFSTWPNAGFQHLNLALHAASPSLLRQRVAGLRSLDASREVYLPSPLRAGDSSGLVVFPYLNQFAHLAGRRLVAPLVQSYQATTAGLDRWYAARIGADPDAGEALYALDGIAVGPIDGIPAITRNPAIFAELFRSFRPVGPDADGYLLLRRTAETRELPSAPIPFRLVATPQSSMPGGVVLAAPAECALLEVRLRADYPWTRSFGRPSAWRVTVGLGDQPVMTSHVVALDRDEFTTFLGLGPPAEMAAVFAGGAPRHAFDRLTFETADRSLFAVAPRAIEVTALECVNP